MLPLARAPDDELRAITTVLTDVDDTLTLHGRLPSAALAAMEQLQAGGVRVIPVTGRPAGWCDHMARLWPVDAVVGENGAFYFRHDNAHHTIQRVHAQDAATRAANSARLMDLSEQVMAAVPGTALAADQPYRDTDVAIDFREDVPPLPLAAAQQVAALFHRAGAVARISSIHVNAWFGTHSKLTMALRLLEDVFGVDAAAARRSVAFCGDSPNDEPMFAHFPMSVGVANVSPFVSLMAHLPRYVTQGEGGTGFAEFAARLLAARR